MVDHHQTRAQNGALANVVIEQKAPIVGGPHQRHPADSPFVIEGVRSAAVEHMREGLSLQNGSKNAPRFVFVRPTGIGRGWISIERLTPQDKKLLRSRGGELSDGG